MYPPNGPAARLFLCGDVMTGRGVDQILPHPSDPRLHESVLRSALRYVELAERAHGAIPRRADYPYVWGDALDLLARERPAARIINLETSITASEDAAPKGINYRLHPANIAVLTAALVDCAVLANNHVLDWGRAGLTDTLDALGGAGIRAAGAGRALADAQAPAVIDVEGGRVLVFAFGAPDSGIAESWSAAPARPGVHRIADFSRDTVDRIALLVRAAKRANDVVIASVHWGGNWGYDIDASHRTFAHALIEQAAVDVVHGHSSHHPKAIEVHRGHPILYGCGDFLNDYEGIEPPDGFRDDLAVMYFPTLDLRTGTLRELEVVPLRIRRFRLERAPAADLGWLRDTLDRECGRFGHHVTPADDRLVLRWR